MIYSIYIHSVVVQGFVSGQNVLCKPVSLRVALATSSGAAYSRTDANTEYDVVLENITLLEVKKTILCCTYEQQKVGEPLRGIIIRPCN